jgi:hypothetical protein
MRWGGAAMLAVGLTMLAIGLAIAGWTMWTRGQWTEVQGTVIEEVLTPFSDGNAYCPVIRYTTRVGQSLTHRSNICAWPAAYEEGEHVRVFYDPANTSNVQIDNFFGTWFMPLLLGFMGLVFSLASIPMLLPDILNFMASRQA